MSAEILRRAAALMRERAGLATPGPWWFEGVWFERTHEPDGRKVHTPHPTVGHGRTGADLIAKTVRRDGADAKHIASWHPGVALAVAGWLDNVAGAVEFGIYDMADEALAVARAYLGEQS